MRITFTLLLVLCLLTTNSVAQQRDCGTMEYLEQEIQQDPERATRLEQIEHHTRQILQSGERDVDGVITIPVVVHVVWNTNAENISDAQVQSQIDVLNEDFRRLNSDADDNWPQASDSEIEFCLATIDPNGNPTNGITRTFTTRSSFSSNNQVKFNASGGHNAWPADQYMNFWVCDLSGGLLGYAQFPGGNPATDGIVCDYLYVGTIGTATPPFDLGRTATHEVGHWLNLRHIWGDGGCGVDDFVSDTPLAGGPNFTGFPCTFPGSNSCNTGANDDPDMFQNYMDYSNDGCMNLFTFGQRNRMRALFEPGGFRESLLNSTVCGTVVATCDDGIQNGDEEGVDCGGSNCDPCPPEPTCDDGIQNGDETGVDCGGSLCDACPPEPTCDDGIQNGTETGVDCGGICPACFTCSDGIQNGNETGVDCGGSCPPCVDCDHNLTLNLTFDILGNHTTWDFVNESGQVVAAGGPYGFGSPGATATENICLGDGCYTFTIYDAGGNGMCCTYGQGGYILSNDETGQVIASGGAFGASEATTLCLGDVVPPTCDDGIQNGDETGVDCGGSNCDPCPPPAPTCDDGIQNGDETGVDCGGPECDPCTPVPTCDDGIQNGDETGVDCGGPDCDPCPPAPTCSDGIQNGNETGVDCGGDCPPCVDCDHNLTLNLTFDILGNHTTWDFVNESGQVVAAGGPYGFGSPGATATENICLGDGCYTFTIYDAGGNGMCCTYGQGGYILSNDETGQVIASGGAFGASEATTLCLGDVVPPTCDDGIQNGDETGVDCGGSNCDPCQPPAPTCDDGIQNGDETGVDCGGSNCDPCQPPAPTCDDGIQNGDETGVDCGGPDCEPCPPVPTCDDGIQNGDETGVDCGGPDCEPCTPIGDCGPPENSFVEYTSNIRVVILHWDAIPDASSYEIRFRRIGTSNWSDVTSNTNSRRLLLFYISDSYEYQIRALCPDGWSEFSDLFTFTPGVARVGTVQEEEIFEGRLYPNPARSTLNVDLLVTTPGEVELVVYDVLGRAVLNNRYDLSAGLHQLKVDASVLEMGYHLVKIRKGALQLVKPFVKQ